MGKLIIHWRKSAIGHPKDQGLTIKALGLKRLNHSVEREDTPSIRGMVHKIRHLVHVEQRES